MGGKISACTLTHSNPSMTGMAVTAAENRARLRMNGMQINEKTYPATVEKQGLRFTVRILFFAYAAPSVSSYMLGAN